MASTTKADVTAALKTYSQARYAEAVAVAAALQANVSADQARAASKAAHDTFVGLLAQIDPTVGASL